MPFLPTLDTRSGQLSGRLGSGGVNGAELVVERADGGGTASWGKCGEVVF